MTSTSTGTRGPALAPSRWWYLLAFVILLAGFAGMAAFIFPRLQAMSGALVQVVVPGEAEMTLDKPGTYTIFHEERSVVVDRVYVSDTISGLQVTVRSAATGEALSVAPTALSETYTFGGRSGKSILAFDVTRPGVYRIAAAHAGGRAQPQAVLAVGHDFRAGLMTTILVSLALVFGCIAAAVVIVVQVWRKRSQALTNPATAARK